MIQILFDPFMLAAAACLAVLVFDLFQGLRPGWRDGSDEDSDLTGRRSLGS